MFAAIAIGRVAIVAIVITWPLLIALIVVLVICSYFKSVCNHLKGVTICAIIITWQVL